MTQRIRPTRWFLPVLFALLLVLTGAGHAASQDAPGDFIPSDCHWEGIKLGPTALTGEQLGFECGYVVVPERHAAPDGPTIRLPVAVRHATAPDARPDPLLLAQGGPGGDAFEVFSLLVPNTEIAATRDIVIFNQRGTPFAEPELTCPETDEALAEMLVAPPEEAQRLYDEALSACAARLQAEGIDLSAYNSLENAADVPLIARALGYDEYNFYGVSYGTLLGLHLMRNHPEGLRSVILDSVVAPDVNFIAELPESEDRVYAEVFAACAADPACNEQYPNLEARFYALLADYRANPRTLTLTDPETGERYEAYLDDQGLRSIVYQLLYVARMPAVLPKVISDLERGDTRYVEAMWPLFIFDQLVAEGMYYSVICAEDADIDPNAVPLEALRPELAETARDDLQTYIDSCALWPVETLDPSIDDPVVSDIPTLLLSGGFDPVTPPPFAAAAAAGLSRAYVLVDPAAGHGVAFQTECPNQIIQSFLDDPTTPPDSSCLAEQALPTVVPPDAITLPLLAGLNQLKTRALVPFLIAGVLLLVVLSAFIMWPLVYLVRALTRKPEAPVVEEAGGTPAIQAVAARSPADRRLRWISRILVLLFGALGLVFGVGLLVFIVRSLTDLTLATALALPSTAAPLLWLPALMLLLAAGIVVAAFLLWRRGGAGSRAGVVYYTIITLCAV
ncbi:alpha/beta fold hydrolase, partial [Promineifilum sp.]|uniref:alpha/beta fold hydrolase n=1 Tax=Promineifilum sp. TaxID=2664178 RepID=UPI0035B239CF